MEKKWTWENPFILDLGFNKSIEDSQRTSELLTKMVKEKWHTKKLEWQKPELIYFEKVISIGNAVLCEDVCTKGNSARYYCSKGLGNK
jgi:hypothetical protein